MQTVPISWLWREAKEDPIAFATGCCVDSSRRNCNLTVAMKKIFTLSEVEPHLRSLHLPRRSGLTHTLIIATIHRAVFFPGTDVLLYVETERERRDALKRIEFILSHITEIPIPEWFAPLKGEHTHDIEFRNGSTIETETFRNDAYVGRYLYRMREERRRAVIADIRDRKAIDTLEKVMSRGVDKSIIASTSDMQTTQWAHMADWTTT